MKAPALHREFKHYALAERGLKPATIRDILSVVRKLCVASGFEEVAALSTPVIRTFLHEGKIENGWAVRTFRLYRQYLKTFFDWCVQDGHLTENPILPIEKPRLPQQLPRCLSRDDSRKVLYAAANYPWRTELQRCRNEAIVATFLMTGLRRAELLNLRLYDLDFNAGTLFVRAGKGRKDRSVPLHPRLAPTLRRYLAERERCGQISDWLFASLKSEKRLTEKNLYAVLKKIGQAARVKFTPHMLRHTFGRELVESDFNIYKLKEVMGHASVETTQVYVALSSQSIKESFEQTKIY